MIIIKKKKKLNTLVRKIHINTLEFGEILTWTQSQINFIWARTHK